MRRFCTILHSIYHFHAKRCKNQFIFHIIPAFYVKKFGFLSFLILPNTLKTHISTVYARSYSHFPQLFPQAGPGVIPQEIGKTPYSWQDANFLHSIKVVVCIFFCIFIHSLNTFHKICKKCRSVSSLLHLFLKGIRPGWIWLHRH